MSKQINQVELGTKCFALQTKNGIAEAIRAEVVLNERDGDFTEVLGRNTITAKGYIKLNQVAGISILSPQMIGDKPNPILEYDDDGVSRVTTRKIAVGYSPIGSLTIIDETVVFDIQSYMKQQVFSAWQSYKNLGDFVDQPSEQIVNKMFIPVIGKRGILMDMNHQEAVKITRDYIAKQKFAERIAASIARRNCLKAHPAIATSTVKFRGGKAFVLVYGFKMDFSRQDVERIAENAADGKAADNAELITHKTAATSEEMACENDIVDPEADSPDDFETPVVDSEEESMSVISKILAMREWLGPKVFDKVVDEDVFDMDTEKQKEVFQLLLDIKSGKKRV